MSDEPQGWGPALEEIERRKAEALSMGGEARLTRQKERGRLNARERILALFDPGSFSEIGQLVGTTEDPPVPGDALVAGSGRIDGRPALAGAEDVTVLGGSIGSGASDKRYRLCQLALQERVPLVMMLEGAGHRVTDSAGGRRPGDLMGLAELSGIVPMVCLVLGASAGHGALTAPLSDFAVMTESASIFAAGPPLVKSATGEEVTKEALGGPQVAADASGVVHNVVADDVEAIALARRYLAYFPLNAWEPPPRRDGPDTGPRRLDGILDLIPPNSRQPVSHRPGARSARRRRVSPRDPADLRTIHRHRPGPAGRAERGHRGQRSECDGGHDRQRGGRQGAHISSTWPEHSGSRASSWPTTPASSRALSPSDRGSSAMPPACSPCSTGSRCRSSTSLCARHSDSAHRSWP